MTVTPPKPLSYVRRGSAERQAAAWNTRAEAGMVCVVGPKGEDGRWPLVFQPVGHAATVVKHRNGVTLRCDCGQTFPGTTQEKAEVRWERHVTDRRRIEASAR